MKNIISNYLKSLAIAVLRKRTPKIIGITGSVGKTTTKEMIYYVLSKSKYRSIYRSYENLNTELGVPLAILLMNNSPKGLGWMIDLVIATFKYLYYISVNKYPEVLILEYGADKMGDIEYLTKIARPDIAVITEVGESHLEYFKSVENVAKEKIKLAKNLNPDGVAILNKDNEYIKKYSKEVFFKKIWYHGSTVNGAKNAALEVAKVMGVKENNAKKILNSYMQMAGRLMMLDGINDSMILDDTYNSNPLSVKNALEKIREVYKDKKYKRKIIILGDMLELGKDEIKIHKQVAANARKTANIFITVGNRFEGIKSDKWFESPVEAGDYLKKIIKKGDIILVKGSQGMRMEKVVEKILKNKKDKKKMVRQNQYWKNKKFISP